MGASCKKVTIEQKDFLFVFFFKENEEGMALTPDLKKVILIILYIL